MITLVEWRNAVLEESEALVHSSETLNKVLKALLTLSIICILTLLEFLVVNVATNGLFLQFKYWLAMQCDTASLTFAFVCLGIFTQLGFQTVQIFGSSPFLLMMFLSTTFSPGAGVPGLKDLRYLFPRFYYWCMLPGGGPGLASVSSRMQGCPTSNLIYLYLILSAFVGVFIFFCFKAFNHLRSVASSRKQGREREQRIDPNDLRELQVELYGENALRRLQQNGDKGDDESSPSNTSESAHQNADASESLQENADGSESPDYVETPEENV